MGARRTCGRRPVTPRTSGGDRLAVGGAVHALGGVGAQAERRPSLDAVAAGATGDVETGPRTSPSWTLVRPRHMCRSDPQMIVVVIRATASVGASTVASGTFSTATLKPALEDDPRAAGQRLAAAEPGEAAAEPGEAVGVSRAPSTGVRNRGLWDSRR